MSGFDDPVAAARAMQTDELRRKLQMDEVRRHLAPGKSKDAKLKEACQGFESIFMNKLWQQMRQSVNDEGYLHSREEKAYVGMFDQEMSKKMAGAGGIGLGRQLYDQLKDRLTKAGASTRTAAHRYAKNELKPLHAERKALPLHPERRLAMPKRPGEAQAGSEGQTATRHLTMPKRPTNDPRENALRDAALHSEATALAAELARRVVAEHRAADAALPGDDLVEPVDLRAGATETESGSGGTR